MADPPAADPTLEDEPWDPLQAEYDDLRQQERERNHADYVKRIRRELKLDRQDAEIDQLERDIRAAAHDDG